MGQWPWRGQWPLIPQRALSQASISSVSPHPHLPSRLLEQIHRCLASSSSNLWDRGYIRRSVSLYRLFTLHYHSTHCLFCLIIVSVFFLSNICISLPTLGIILYIGVIGSTLLEAHRQGKPTPCSHVIIFCYGITVAKKKGQNCFLNVTHSSNEKNIAKSMTVLKLCKRSSK